MALKVIGSGLGRTGTKSMHTALNRLGFGPCHHMVEVFMHPETMPLWVAAAKGSSDWDRLFEGYCSMVDWPGVQYWRELAAHYPDAKVLHTTRDAEAWFDSTQATIFNPVNLERFSHGGPIAEFFSVALGEVKERINDRAYMIDYFHRHEAEVKATIAPERLLIYPVGSGWEPLCAFLGVEVPDEPYPSENSRADFAQRSAAVAAGLNAAH
ncbi:MAG TPA: sulfotransferase [Caulobacteraceae bacterium]|jgi:hypothetical protein